MTDELKPSPEAVRVWKDALSAFHLGKLGQDDEAAALVIDRALRPATMPGDVVERAAWAMFYDEDAFHPTDCYTDDDLTECEDNGGLKATVEGEVNFTALATAALTTMQPAIQAAVDALEPVGNMEMWTESAADSEMVLMTVGTIRKMRSTLATLRTVSEQGEG